MTAKLLILLLTLTTAPAVSAGVIILSGTVGTILKGTNPVSSDPNLNGVKPGDSFTLELHIEADLTGPPPGLKSPFPLDAGNVLNIPAAHVSETIDAGVLNFTRSNGLQLFHGAVCPLLANICLTERVIVLNFAIPEAQLYSANVTAQPFDQLVAFDLTADNNAIDISGQITGYSYISSTASSVPEPSCFLLMTAGLGVALYWRHRIRPTKFCNHNH